MAGIAAVRQLPKRCAELCGMNHFKMKSYLLVLPQSDFDSLTQMPQAQFQERKNQLLDSYQLPQY